MSALDHNTPASELMQRIYREGGYSPQSRNIGQALEEIRQQVKCLDIEAGLFEIPESEKIAASISCSNFSLPSRPTHHEVVADANIEIAVPRSYGDTQIIAMFAAGDVIKKIKNREGVKHYTLGRDDFQSYDYGMNEESANWMVNFQILISLE